MQKNILIIRTIVFVIESGVLAVVVSVKQTLSIPVEFSVGK